MLGGSSHHLFGLGSTAASRAASRGVKSLADFPKRACAALYTNAVWGKRRTLEIYLNVAEWGDGIFGAEAAAQARFAKSARDLTPREAALLAAVLPSPNKWRLDPPSTFVDRRANTLIQRAEIIRTSGYDSCLNL